MAKLEDLFTLELLANAQTAHNEFNYNFKKFAETIEKFGGVKTAKELIKKNRSSDAFVMLCDNKRLDLSMEATVTKSKYGELFTDEEVNFCFQMLCDNGFYKG